MTTSDYSSLFELVIQGSVKQYTRTGDESILKEPARLMMLLREELPFTEKTKLLEAIMASHLDGEEEKKA